LFFKRHCKNYFLILTFNLVSWILLFDFDPADAVSRGSDVSDTSTLDRSKRRRPSAARYTLSPDNQLSICVQGKGKAKRKLDLGQCAPLTLADMKLWKEKQLLKRDPIIAPDGELESGCQDCQYLFWIYIVCFSFSLDKYHIFYCSLYSVLSLELYPCKLFLRRTL